MQLRGALNSGIERLTLANVGSPRINAEVLLMFSLAVDRAYLYAHAERELTPDEYCRYDRAVAERARGVPTQYITGHQEFWGLDFIVSPSVLIPRPETEHVVETVLELVRNLPTKNSTDQTLSIADIGTGSGCIAIALAHELPNAKIYATDISAPALDIAHANSARHQLETRIHFRQADLLEDFPPNSLDFVVSNPPYVGQSEEDQVQLEVRKFEPRNAVFAGRTGTEVIARLVPQAWDDLRRGGWLIFEISGTIVAQVRNLLGCWGRVEIRNDLQGIPRVACARKTL